MIIKISDIKKRIVFTEKYNSNFFLETAFLHKLNNCCAVTLKKNPGYIFFVENLEESPKVIIQILNQGKDRIVVVDDEIVNFLNLSSKFYSIDSRKDLIKTLFKKYLEIDGYDFYSNFGSLAEKIERHLTIRRLKK